jgi:hypothetical protein
MQVTDNMVVAATQVLRDRAGMAPEQNPEGLVVRLMLEAAMQAYWDGIVAAAGGHVDEARRLPAS